RLDGEPRPVVQLLADQSRGAARLEAEGVAGEVRGLLVRAAGRGRDEELAAQRGQRVGLVEPPRLVLRGGRVAHWAIPSVVTSRSPAASATGSPAGAKNASALPPSIRARSASSSPGHARI